MDRQITKPYSYRISHTCNPEWDSLPEKNKMASLTTLHLSNLTELHWSHRAYQNHNILHMFKLLGVEEGRELLSVCRQVSIQIGSFKPPLVTREHLLEAELVCRVLKLIRVG